MAMRYRCGSSDCWREAVTENVSRSGVLFVADIGETVVMNTRVEMRLKMPDIGGSPAARVICSGRVARIDHAPPGPRAHVAVTIDRYRLEPGGHGGNPE
jgi:hypothetical protein